MKDQRISFENITPDSWEQLKLEILNSELTFSQIIRLSEEELLEVLKTEKYVAKIIRLDGKYIGNIIGYDAHYAYSFEELTRYTRKKIIHIDNIVIDAQYRGKGYGKLLLEELITEAQAKGYSVLLGYFRQSGSLPLIKKKGGIIKKSCENWLSTGETYFFCELDISK